ncbi:MAG: cysteine desulfurase family protein [Clostridia bacterium]|nr:cysteine desulfurase family protein [Clostridia bacterium]
MIFFDNASTTKLSEKAVDNLIKFSVEKFYNPSSVYLAGIENFKQIESVKKLVCEKLNLKFDNNIIFTGSATEASNLAINGSFKKSFKKLLFSKGEHASVYNTAQNLQANGAEVDFINLQKNGEIDYADFEKKLSPDVNFISIIHISNESGAINDLKRICSLKEKICPKALLHIDGVQAFGKIKTDFSSLNLDFYTISAHKIHGPKGLGVLYVKNPDKLKPQIFGGGQEYNLRSGTENTAAIMAFKTVLEEIGNNEQIENQFKNVLKIKQTFVSRIKELIEKDIPISFIEKNENLSPYITSFSIPGLKGETLLRLCDSKGLLIGTGSACSSKKSGNRIFEAMGQPKKVIDGNIRVSFSKDTTHDEVEQGSKILADCINELYFKINHKNKS